MLFFYAFSCPWKYFRYLDLLKDKTCTGWLFLLFLFPVCSLTLRFESIPLSWCFSKMSFDPWWRWHAQVTKWNLLRTPETCRSSASSRGRGRPLDAARCIPEMGRGGGGAWLSRGLVSRAGNDWGLLQKMCFRLRLNEKESEHVYCDARKNLPCK